MSDATAWAASGGDAPLPRMGDLVWIGEEAGGQYADDPIRFRVMDVAPIGEHLAMTGWEVYDLTPEEEAAGAYRISRHRTVLPRRAGVRVIE